jgi:hypothetical protein
MVTLAHQVRLEPNRREEEYFRKACGISRFAWNWGYPNGRDATSRKRRSMA